MHHLSASTNRYLSFLTRTGVKVYSGDEPALHDTQKMLSQFSGGSVKLTKNDDTGIATICLHRPDKKNAIGGQMLIELSSAADDLATWSTGKGFIIYGDNNIFGSGGDLAMSRATCTEEQGFALSRYAQSVTTKLRTLPLLSVALIEGVALGGSAEISVAACDWRLMSPDSHIGFVHGRMGLNTGWGGGVALKKLLGQSTALELMASARLVSAFEAKGIGLATAVLGSSENGLEQAKEWLVQRTLSAVEVVRAAKATVMGKDYQEELEIESRLHAPLWGGQAKLDALQKNIKHK